ncbi:MFS transporter [Micromonospora sp. NPDC050417]|uniref:MFS transporter n=1 Tax=Micromonospora sp. NPDC050417 TaxID=3364280 RepID=UPI0037A3196C
MTAVTEDNLSGHPRRWAALGVLSLTLVAVTLDNSVLNTALPSLARDLHASTADLQWITDAYTLIFASALILAGAIGTRLGMRRALIGGLVVFGGGSVAAALSDTPTQLIAWRAVMGLGAAFVMPATLAIVTRMFPPHERAKAFGAWSAAAGVGVLVGPVTGGALLLHFSWSSTFWINVPIVALALAGILAVVPRIPAQSSGRLDLLGALLSTLAIAALVDAIIEAPQRGWTDTTTLGETGAAILLAAVFVWWELRVPHPLVRLDLFANRRFGLASLALAVTFFALFGTLFELSQYLQLVHGYSPLLAGLGAVPFAVAMSVASATSSLTTARLGTARALTIGLLLVAAGLGALATATTDTAFPVIAGFTAIVGLGMGMLMAPASLEINGSVPARYASMASSLQSVIRELGGVLGIAVVGAIVSTHYRSTMADAPSVAGHDLPSAHAVAAATPPPGAGELLATADHAFTVAMGRGLLVAAGVALVAAIAVGVGLRRRPTPESVPSDVAEPEVVVAG